MPKLRDELPSGLPRLADDPPVEWRESRGLIAYDRAVAVMDRRAAAIAAARADELVWLLEHPPVYTAGTSANAKDLLDAQFPVFACGRGGRFTYHGPGQRVAYVLLDLRHRSTDVRRFVTTLETWLIRTLAALGVPSERREDRVGVWVSRGNTQPGREDKIAAIGVRVRHWVTLHGVSLNVAPNLAHFAGIVPCGVSAAAHGVTSLAALGKAVPMNEVDAALRREFEQLFGASRKLGGDPPELDRPQTVFSAHR